MATPPWTPDPVASYAPPDQRRGTSGCLIAGVVAAIVAVLVLAIVAAVVLAQRLGDESRADGGPGDEPAAAAGAPSSAATRCHWLTAAANQYTRAFKAPPTLDPPATGTQTMTITTNRGVIKIEVDTAKAPCTAASMTHLAGQGYFDDSPCHRLTTEGISVLQCGDPSGTGMGGPLYRYAEENLPNDTDPGRNYPIGTLAMARTAEPETTGSQFFIVWGPSPLAGDYTVLGRVTSGLDVVTAIGRAGAVDGAGNAAPDGAPRTPVTITTLTITAAGS